MRDHTKLRAFELADEVVLLIYRATREFPKEEIYGLTSQMRRAVSVPSNIIEGCARESQTEYLRFLEIAFGSLRELHDLFGLSKRLGIMINMTFLAANQKLWRLRRFWAPWSDQCEKTNSL